MLRHLMTSLHLNIWKVKFDYLKNGKRFRSEIKNIFLASQLLSFTLTKHTCKNVAGTTSKQNFVIYWTPLSPPLQLMFLKFCKPFISSADSYDNLALFIGFTRRYASLFHSHLQISNYFFYILQRKKGQ